MSNIRFNQIADFIRNEKIVMVLYEGIGKKELWKAKFVISDTPDQWENYMEWSVENGIRADWDFDYCPTNEEYMNLPSFDVDLVNEISGERLNGMPITVYANSDDFFWVDDEDGNWSVDDREVLYDNILSGQLDPLYETKAPEKYWDFHHKDCGTAYRGCHPTKCPKNQYEKTGIWKLLWD